MGEDGSEQPIFEFALDEGHDGTGPYINFGLPDECWPQTGYDGAGIFLIDFESLLEDCLKSYWCNSGGEFTPRLINLLRSYADKIEQDLKERLSA